MIDRLPGVPVAELVLDDLADQAFELSDLPEAEEG
jgi:hypothetical protein